VDINMGSGDGIAASPAVSDAVMEVAATATDYTSILNGRSRAVTSPGAMATDRLHRGNQLELSQITYMNEDPPFRLREDLAAGIRPVLRRILEALLSAGAKRYRGAATVRTAV